MSKLWLAILLFFVLLSLLSQRTSAFASDQPPVTYESINPDSLIYPLKRIGEKVKLMFINGENKSKYNFDLLNIRFNELIFIANYKKSGFLQETASRYNSHIGQMKAEKYFKDQNKIRKFIKILEAVRDQNPANSAPWLIMQQTLDTTKSLL